MKLAPIRTEIAYQEALCEIDRLMDAEFGTEDGDRLDILTTLVEVYEQKQYPMDLPDPVEAIKFSMEQLGLVPSDLTPMIGHKNRVYDILNKKRNLTLPMIRKIHTGLGIPAECLIKA